MTAPGPPEPDYLEPVGSDPMIGAVAEFDAERGIGVVEYGVGRRVPFHCTAISDGSRRIEVGTVVAFAMAAGRLGRLEARAVRPLPGVVPPGSSLVAEPHRAGEHRGGPLDVATEPAPSTAPSDRAQPVPEAPESSGSPGSDPAPERAEPRPDFFAPFRRPSAGPPPTWRTPVTPGPSRAEEE